MNKMPLSADRRPPSGGRNSSPTYAPLPPAGLSSVLERNIQSLEDRRLREEADASAQERIADAITRFTGSMLFVYLHLAVFGFWIVANLGWVPGVPRWDESFVVLAMIASVEAIFLYLRANQPKPHGSSRKQAGGPRFTNQFVSRARDYEARHAGRGDRFACGCKDQGGQRA